MIDVNKDRDAFSAHPFKPLLDNVLVREIKLDTESRIHIPGQPALVRSERFQKASDRGEVIAVGDGVPIGGVLMPMPVKPGDTVVTSEYGRDPIYLDPEDEFRPDTPKYYTVRVADIRGIFRAS